MSRREIFLRRLTSGRSGKFEQIIATKVKALSKRGYVICLGINCSKNIRLIVRSFVRYLIAPFYNIEVTIY